ncbi:hypothetical protein ASG43_03285 [Aureimonas sp. Leaf454]|uniref:hypothetical protein n=1 Tax=Aureimonas sp. Leaf454 TaxID=1736381 RepID=UPI0006F7F122|nr:hypothetical protein [Aureimonas sp. Leaf454]KQT54623.1 hypothetical protein ASG43_03285 [Aureimonas sp. Leaf454]
MSGIVSGITKVFQSVGSAVARVGQAVSAVGAATFTAGAATGAKSLASGGLSQVASSMGNSVLGNVLTGAVKQAAMGAIIGGGISALTGNGFGKGALMGGLGGAVTGGLTGLASGTGLMPAAATTAPAADAGLQAAQTATGVAPTGITSSAPNSARFGENVPAANGRGGLASALNDQTASLTRGAAAAPAVAAAAAPAAAAGGGGGLMSFLGTETGGNVLAGLGEGAMAYYKSKEDDKKLKMQAEEYDKSRATELEKEMRLRASYNMSDAVYEKPMPQDTTVRPTPAQAYGRTRFEYDPAQGRIVSVAA